LLLLLDWRHVTKKELGDHGSQNVIINLFDMEQQVLIYGGVILDSPAPRIVNDGSSASVCTIMLIPVLRFQSGHY
jgi:hypothetical protein